MTSNNNIMDELEYLMNPGMAKMDEKNEKN